MKTIFQFEVEKDTNLLDIEIMKRILFSRLNVLLIDYDVQCKQSYFHNKKYNLYLETSDDLKNNGKIKADNLFTINLIVTERLSESCISHALFVLTILSRRLLLETPTVSIIKTAEEIESDNIIRETELKKNKEKKDSNNGNSLEFKRESKLNNLSDFSEHMT